MRDNEEDVSDKRYREMILKLNGFVKKDELEKMKFLCKDFIMSKKRDGIDDFIKLIIVLEERKKVGGSNVAFLRQLLMGVDPGRKDWLDPINKYETLGRPGEESIDAIPEYPQRDYTLPELREPISFLERKLGRDWRFFVRALGIEDHDIDNLMDEFPRNVKEQIHRSIKIYLNDKRENSCKQDLIDACLKVKRMDLAKKLELGDYV